MYSIYSFGSMITNSERMAPYVQALRAAIKPNSIVVDIGTGTGIFALLACQFGARKVYAIEPNNAIILAKEIAAANRLTHKIEFIHDMSSNISLPEPADVIISDLRGAVPLFQHHIPSILDARKRLLAPNGVLIPQQDTLWATLVEAEDLYNPYSSPWTKNAYDLDMTAGQKIVTNTWRKARVSSKQFLVEPQIWGNLDYRNIEDPNISTELTWTTLRKGTAHGLALWFDALLADGIGFSNSPDSPELVYGNAFLPLTEAVAIDEGDRIDLRIAANLVGEDYIWNWDTKIIGANGIKANFKQSTFYATPLSLEQLHKSANNYVPRLSEAAQVDLTVLNLMNESKPLSEIAEHVLASFPSRFNTLHSALTYVGQLSVKYSD